MPAPTPARTRPCAADAAAAIIHAAAGLGVNVRSGADIITAEIPLPAGGAAAAEQACAEILGMFPQTRPGTTWTHSSGGYYRASKSGVDPRLTRRF
jgi:hypothetical protein